MSFETKVAIGIAVALLLVITLGTISFCIFCYRKRKSRLVLPNFIIPEVVTHRVEMRHAERLCELGRRSPVEVAAPVMEGLSQEQIFAELGSVRSGRTGTRLSWTSAPPTLKRKQSSVS